MSLLLDSHTLLWFLEDHPNLSSVAADAIEAEQSPLLLSVISVAESQRVIRKRSTGNPAAAEAALYEFIEQSGRVETVPVTYEIIRRALTLSELDGIHDQIIAATALVSSIQHANLRLVTRDRIVRSSKLVPTLW